MANIVNNVKEAGSTVLSLGKTFLIPMFFGLIIVGLIVGFFPAAKKFLQ